MEMQHPDQLLKKLRTRWKNQRCDWLGGGGKWPLAFSTQSPNEQQAEQHWDLFGAWLRSWQRHEGPGRVIKETCHWRRLGTQELPDKWQFASADEVAVALGESQRWQQANARYRFLQEHWQARESIHWPACLSRHVDLLADMPEADFVRLHKVVAWLDQHRDSGLFLRQLPIAGIDSKWIRPRRAVIADWLAALRGLPESNFYEIAGLRRKPVRLRIRLLDPLLRERAGGLHDISAPVEEIAALRLPVRRVVVVENLATGLAFGDLPGTVLFMARGYAVKSLASIDWLRALPVDYWGDIDTHGFAILHRLRSHLPQVRSLLMDEATLLAHRQLWGEEDEPHAASELSALTAKEHKLYEQLHHDYYAPRLRLEQERIGWDFAWPQIHEACSGLSAVVG